MLKIPNTFLLVIDMQESLLKAMPDEEGLTGKARRLIRAAGLLDIPVLSTEQAPDKLGPVSELIRPLLKEPPIAKYSFSCAACEGFQNALARLDRRQALLCGVEAHVCVYQTAIDLASNGYDVQVVADGVDSRDPFDKQIGLEKIRAGGAVLTTVETALFELLGTSRHPAFKKVQELIK